MKGASGHPTVAFVAPFLIYVGMMALPLRPEVLFPVRLVVVAAVILLWSRNFLAWKPSYLSASIAVGVVVFLVWIAPDSLFGYRHHWLFENPITGRITSSLTPSLQHDPWFLTIRVLSSVVLVPVLEELFWRGWLMRWLVNAEFQKVPLGTFDSTTFLIVAVLFACEHGPYWEVGLAAGLLYNWWIVRTKNLADCILAHAVTNAILAAYVLVAGQWGYWL
jgi:CAAX prenyl protease-like protein